MTPSMIESARHALGLPNDKNQSYRNRFIAGQFHEDFNDWETMCNCGWADKREGKALPFAGDNMYWLTSHGANLALKDGEKLCPEDFPKVATTNGKDKPVHCETCRKPMQDRGAAKQWCSECVERDGS